ncbi:MAG: 30S ribosomal protein S8, partial [Patescibacteria group bacterium]|nr:30S ribosomal protein S8 [Patescibacteria group bacterium]
MHFDFCILNLSEAMDPITEMFNRIKNAQAVGKKTVEVNFSNLKEAVAEILKKEGFIVDCKKRGRQPHQFIKMVLSYGKDKLPALEGFKRVSKPGQRIYKKTVHSFPS